MTGEAELTAVAVSEEVREWLPVATMADLRLMAPTATRYIELLGFTSKGDGGYDRFYYDTTSTATDDSANGSGLTTVVKPTSVTGAGRWLRLRSATSVLTLPTITALKALTGMVDGQVVEVTSYYASATPDGGGGRFKWDSTSTATDNGGTIIATDAGGSGRWRRIPAVADAERQTQQVMQRLEFDEDANIIVFGDSTGDGDTEWIHLLAEKLGDDYPTHTVAYRKWNTTSDTYDAASTIQTGSGASTLTVWNSAVSGSVATRFAGTDLVGAARPSAMGQDPDLVILSYGHNGGSNIERQYPMTATMAGEVARLLPFTPIILVGQNPVTTDETMSEKVRVFKALAAAQGFGFIDINAHFTRYLSPLADYYLPADTVHPNADGSEVWADTVHYCFRYNGNAAGGNGHSSLNRGLILSQDTYLQFSEWTTSASFVIAKETTEYETRGESAKFTGGGSGGDYAYKEVISSTDIRAYRGRYVTASVRVQVPDGSATDVGRIALYDGTTTVTTANGGPQGTGWSTQSITLKVGDAATYLRLYIYVSLSAPSSEFLYVDRVTVSDGPIPRDVQASRTEELDYLRVLGYNANGVLVVRNSNTGGNGIQILDASGADTDNPGTDYTVAIGSALVGFKAKTDAAPRVQINNATGLLLFGQGTSAPGIQISATGSNLLRIVGAHFYNQDDNTYDDGLVNKRWRRNYSVELRPGAGAVIWTSGTGTPEGAVTAPIGSLFTRTDGGAGTTLYVKESGSGNTGWVAK